jgi:hypothetical protein
VLSIELVNGSIPAYVYNIQPAWGSFTFYEALVPFVGPAVTATITLTPGFYTEAALITELQTRLNSTTALRNTYSVTQNPNTRKITVTSNGVTSFKFLFYSGQYKDEYDLNTLAVMSINCPARLLGFGYEDYSSGTDYSKGKPVPAATPNTLVAVLPMDLENFLNRVYLHIESDGKNLDCMEQSAGRQDCFHIFFIAPGQYDYRLLDKETDRSIFTSSPAPLARMSNLEISIRDEFGRYMDLNFRELNLVFEIRHLQ